MRRAADQRGVALSSPVALLSAAAVVDRRGRVLRHRHRAARRGRRHSRSPPPRPRRAPTPAKTAPKPVIKEKKKPKKPPVRRAGTYVEVYNNSGISGLAGTTAARASGAGWKVVGSDNWYGTIPASTVYYPERLEAEAKLLGRDLGIRRVRPSISPMRLDRLTVILTTDYRG